MTENNQQTKEEYIDDVVEEYRERYDGILPPQVIDAGADWYEQKLSEAIEWERERILELVDSKIKADEMQERNQAFMDVINLIENDHEQE